VGKVIKSKKGIALLAALVVAIVAAVGAYAYFTNSGSGQGTASVGSSSAIAITGSTAGNLYPAGPARTVSITLHNTGAGAQHVATTSLDSISSSDPLCDTSLNSAGSAFTFVNPVAVNADLAADNAAAGGPDETTVTGSLQMNDTGVSQDDCQGEALTLHFSSN
jgi:hypothetical protein